MPSTKSPTHLPYDLQSFITRTQRLIALEQQEEQSYDAALKAKLTFHQLQQLGIVLTQLTISESYTGLYGRQLLVLQNRRGLATHLKSHTFSVRDIVCIVPHNVAVTSVSTSSDASNVIASGTIYKITDASITIAIERDHDVINTDSLPSSLCLIKQTNDVTYQRYNAVMTVLQQVHSGTRHNEVHSQRILDVLYRDIPPTQSVTPYQWQPLSTALNERQIQAITHCMSSNDVHLIHGPPGTGKTTTVCELIYQLTQRNERVLVCAPSNIAVDNIVEKLSSQYTVKCIRLGHPARLLPEVLKHSLDSVVARSDISAACNGIRKDIKVEQQKLFKVTDKVERYAVRGEIRALQNDLKQRERHAVSDEITHCQVICCTLTGAASKQLSQFKYDTCIIDEAAQSLEIACVIPAINAKRLVLAGDHCQLGPTIKSDAAARDGLSTTLFDRLIKQYDDSSNIATLLNVQYRMHDTIMKWSSNEFYHGKLVSDSSVASHLLPDLPSVQRNDITSTPFMLIDTAGCDMYEVEKTDTGNVRDMISDSKSNTLEADVVAKHVQRLVDAGIRPTDIAVIAPYNAQVGVLRELLTDTHAGIEIGTVDGLQGREKQCVVISMTRSNAKGEIGFLSEARRMNVAVTRAKRHVCVVGDSETVLHDAVLKRLMEYIEEYGEVYSAAEYTDDTVHSAAATVSDTPTTVSNGDAPAASGSSLITDLLSSKPVNIKRKPQGTPTPTLTHNATTASQHETTAANVSSSTAKPSIASAQLAVPLINESDIETICNQLLQRIQGGDLNATYRFDASLDGVQRKLVHEIAERVGGLSHESEGVGRKRHIKLQSLHKSPSVPQQHSATTTTTTARMEDVALQPALAHATVLTDADRQAARLKAIAAMEHRSKAKVTTPQLVQRIKPEATFDILDAEDTKEEQTSGSQSHAKAHLPAVAASKPVHSASDINVADDDIDAIMSDLRVGACHQAACNVKLGMMGMTCKFCNEVFCMKHYSPVMHSDACAKQYGQQARSNDMKSLRQGQSDNAHVQRGDKSLTSSQKHAMQAKLDAAKAKVQHKAAVTKPKAKK